MKLSKYSEVVMVDCVRLLIFVKDVLFSVDADIMFALIGINIICRTYKTNFRGIL